MPSPTPFKVSCPPELLARLRSRLDDVVYPKATLPDSESWTYGMPPRVLRRLVESWKTYLKDWSSWERKLNSVPHYKMDVNGLNVHFIHYPSPRADAIPLLLIHGWPGSFFEFLQIIRPLAEPEDSSAQAFHVVVPSLPGYGFSDSPTRKEYAIVQSARAFDQLMKELGYPKYIAQGGDWGSSVSKALALVCSDSCRAVHLNMAPFSRPPKSVKIDLNSEEEANLERGRRWRRQGVGYQEIQGTKPQTLGVAISDSPVGLLAWIGEKFHEWVDLRGGDGDFSPTVPDEALITNVMIYLISNCATSSFMLYYWSRAGLDAKLLNESFVEIPLGFYAFPGEIFVPPKAWVAYWAKRLVHWSEAPRGGHFAALENGSFLVSDIRLFGRNPEVRSSLGLSKF
ncbi:epoxide hydrolase 1 [Hyaloraphidium curvatum]|nr:epoxide hydrolase 1 [Hyaloraphidium curvatum]